MYLVIILFVLHCSVFSLAESPQIDMSSAILTSFVSDYKKDLARIDIHICNGQVTVEIYHDHCLDNNRNKVLCDPLTVTSSSAIEKLGNYIIVLNSWGQSNSRLLVTLEATGDGSYKTVLDYSSQDSPYIDYELDSHSKLKFIMKESEEFETYCVKK